MCVCVCEVGSYWHHALLFCCGHHMDHFLIQDSEVFPVLEVIPEADLLAGITASVRGHLSLLLFPESPFPPLFHSAKMGTVIWNNGHLLPVAEVHWRPKLLLLLSPQVSPWGPVSAFWDPHLTAASPTDCHAGTGESQQLPPALVSWNLPRFYFKSSVECGDEISWCS